ncbi:hypothetical protein HNQ34_000936 [Anoxybacillus tepidamans]|uniref:Uncharacterized protein n=1 Tax=Anoxybacteroides tepidamans TaxID=265948 RepID=A0A7W8IQE8_9BACL|nr:hypothetical protein [Anoxybacillus tepidamans]
MNVTIVLIYFLKLLIQFNYLLSISIVGYGDRRKLSVYDEIWVN